MPVDVARARSELLWVAACAGVPETASRQWRSALSALPRRHSPINGIKRLPHFRIDGGGKIFIGSCGSESLCGRLLGHRHRDVERDLSQLAPAAATDWRADRAARETVRQWCARPRGTCRRICGAPATRWRRDRCPDRHRRCWSGRPGSAWPSRTTGGNGLPVPMTARPSVQASRSSGVASLRSVGLDSGKITGRRTRAAMARTTGFGKARAAVRTCRSAPSAAHWRPRRRGRSDRARQASTLRPRRAALRERRLKRLQSRHAVDQQAIAVDQIEPAARFGLRQAGIDHGAAAAARRCRCPPSRHRTPRYAARQAACR